MIKFSEIKNGDYVLATSDGEVWQGEVVNLHMPNKQVCVYNGVQEFWFEENEISAVPLDESQLMKLNFEKEKMDDGTVKYKKGAFRILLPADGDFSHFELWYRDENRHILHPIAVHELQNHYHDMTKVHLTDEAFVQ
jgi:hypothetical protein